MLINTQKKRFLKIRLFFLPFENIKLKGSIFLIIFLGFMFAIRIGLGYLSIPIKVFGFSVSFAWLPVYVVGWFYGPMVGLFFGAFCDTMDWMLHGSVWFWMYAIQEPIIGLISGLFASCYRLFKNKSIIIQWIILEIIIWSFLIFTLLFSIFQFNQIDKTHFQDYKNFQNEQVFIILISIFISLFMIVLIIQNYKMYKNYKHSLNNDHYLKYLYISSLIILGISLFSFLLGPITNVKYIQFLNGVTPNSYLKYGFMYYLIPRVLKESIKTPIYIILVFYIISAIDYSFKLSLNNLRNKWSS